MSNTMTFTEENLAKMNRDRLIELIFMNGLPTSQAVAYHLICDLSYRPCDAARLIGVSQIAVTDAKNKGLKKLKEE